MSRVLPSFSASALLVASGCLFAGSASAGVVRSDEIVGEIDFSKLTKIADVKDPRAVAKNLALLSSNWTTGFTAGNANGQNGWAAFGGTTTGTSNYQITASRPGGASGQGLAITKNTTSTRFLYKDATTAFAGRAATENQVWADFDIYYGGSSTANSARGGSMDSNGVNSTAVAGIDLGTSGTTHVAGRLRGYAYLTSAAAGGAAAGNYVFNLGLTLSSAQWVKFSTVKELDTGRVTWFYSVDGGTNWAGAQFDAGLRTISTMEFDYIVTNSALTTSQTVNFGDAALYTVPSPGAVALMGVAGLIASRRRRD